MGMKSNVSRENISVERAAKRPVSMKLPRTDDGNVHEAVGERENNSAAFFADAQAKVFGGSAGSAMKQPSGGK